MPVSILMDKVPVVLTADMNLVMARRALIKQSIEVAYVVNEQQQLLGQINVLNLLELNDEHLRTQSVGKFLSEPAVVLEENMNVLEIFPKLKSFVGVNIPVVTDGISKQLVGIIYTSKLAEIYLQTLDKPR